MAEGKKLDCKFIPRPICNWATHSQTGNPGEGSGSRVTPNKGPVRKWCPESYENKQQQWKDAHKQSQGHQLVPQKVSSPLLSFPLKGFLGPLTREESKGCGYFQELRLPSLVSPQLIHVADCLDCKLFKGRRVSCTSS